MVVQNTKTQCVSDQIWLSGSETTVWAWPWIDQTQERRCVKCYRQYDHPVKISCRILEFARSRRYSRWTTDTEPLLVHPVSGTLSLFATFHSSTGDHPSQTSRNLSLLKKAWHQEDSHPALPIHHCPSRICFPCFHSKTYYINHSRAQVRSFMVNSLKVQGNFEQMLSRRATGDLTSVIMMILCIISRHLRSSRDLHGIVHRQASQF